MRIAVPTSGGRLSPHFGRCEAFALMDVDPESRQVVSSKKAVPPAHGPGVFPQWLRTLEVDVIIVGGMGMRAIQLFEAAGIEVVRGAVVGTPQELARDYLSQQLALGPDPCDHGEGHNCQHESEEGDFEG